MSKSKYAPLQGHLKNLKSSSWKTSFDKIEEILGFALPHSAYTFPAWWGNHVQNSRHTKAWMDIGWEVETVYLGKSITFRRAEIRSDLRGIHPEPNSIFNNALHFYSKIENEQYARFRSWEHCYYFFKSNPKDVELACLHLGFYLASWGMYRGSSFLLQRDYLVHETAVRKILSPQYSNIHGISLEQIKKDTAGELADIIFGLSQEIKSSYHSEDSLQNVSDTLATKILLGTLGCVPAYDRFFVLGLKQEGFDRQALSKRNISELMDYCKKHEAEILEVEKELSKKGKIYPVMKIMDMHFWEIGRKLANLEENA